MKIHVESQHTSNWSKYCGLGDENKQSFFDEVFSVANTLRAHFQGETELRFEIGCDILQVLVGEMLFDQGSDDAVAVRDRALRFFTRTESSDSGSSGGEDDEDAKESYSLLITSARLFHIVVKFVARGASFRMAALLAADTQEVTKMSCFTGATTERVSHFVSAVCTSNLQIIAAFLKRCWAFGIALDVGSKRGTNYLDIRVRFNRKAKLHKLYLLAISLHGGKTAPAIFGASSRMLDALAPRWKNQLIGGSTDGRGYVRQFSTVLRQACIGA